MNKILFVDDEAFVLKVIVRKLENENFKVYTANNSKDAYQILRENDIDVVVADIQMPGENGIDFLKKVQSLSPRTIRIIMSGYQRTASIIDAINEGHVYQYISKPWHLDKAAIDFLQKAIGQSKVFKEEHEDYHIPLNQVNKFRNINHFVLVDSTGKIVYKNSDYPMIESDLSKARIKIQSDRGQLNLIDLEG